MWHGILYIRYTSVNEINIEVLDLWQLFLTVQIFLCLIATIFRTVWKIYLDDISGLFYNSRATEI